MDPSHLAPIPSMRGPKGVPMIAYLRVTLAQHKVNLTITVDVHPPYIIILQMSVIRVKVPALRIRFEWRLTRKPCLLVEFPLHGSALSLACSHLHRSSKGFHHGVSLVGV